MLPLGLKSLLRLPGCALVLITIVIWNGAVFVTHHPTFAEDHIKVGIIGCDTSHAPAFARILNETDTDETLSGIHVVAAYPIASEDIPLSRDRVEGFTEELRRMGIEIVDSINTLLEMVDVVLLESVDGRRHLEQVRPVFAAGKSVYIDKPLAASLTDVLRIARLSEEHNTPFFSCSSMRFSPMVLAASDRHNIGNVSGCSTYSPCTLEPTHADLYWYGIHGVESLFTIMGPGCQRVSRIHTDGTDLVVGTWESGRIGTFRGLRAGSHDYGATVFGTKANTHINGFDGYRSLVIEIARFFKTNKPPVRVEDTIEVFAYMEAADESARQGGTLISLESVLAKARSEVEKTP